LIYNTLDSVLSPGRSHCGQPGDSFSRTSETSRSHFAGRLMTFAARFSRQNYKTSRCSVNLLGSARSHTVPEKIGRGRRRTLPQT
jgi:hypothetical protein